jgi:hypothetical protein
MGSALVTALARAESPEDVVRVIVERAGGFEAVSAELPTRAMSLIERIASAADAESIGVGRVRKTKARSTRRATRKPDRQVEPQVLRPNSVYRNAPSSSGARRQPQSGSSGVMKLAGKLMKLIHLAEAERRVSDAQAQVRMAEDTASARAEGGLGEMSQQSETEVNIKALQQDVLDAVLRELELVQARREDPDGRNIWW